MIKTGISCLRVHHGTHIRTIHKKLLSLKKERELSVLDRLQEASFVNTTIYSSSSVILSDLL
jgi:hypothetical protein